jgi:type II secretory pathway pseudopilin PulG
VLLQSLVTITIMVLLAGALLTSSLVSAKVAIHEAATRHVATALARGTDDFSRWAANFVYTNRADAQWPAQPQTTAPEAACGAGFAAPTVQTPPCAFFVTTTYHVTGSTTVPLGNGGPAGNATAQNLQTLVDEQRISADVTATITNASGTVLGAGTRELTLRVFDAPPYAIVTGTRDVSTVLGSEHAAEGDTGGADEDSRSLAQGDGSPDTANPSSYKDTVINVTMTCTNSPANSDQSNPNNDNHAPGNEGLPWGVQDVHGGFEAPCLPTYGIAQVPVDAHIPKDGSYSVGAFAGPRTWSNGSQASGSAWAQ